MVILLESSRLNALLKWQISIEYVIEKIHDLFIRTEAPISLSNFLIIILKISVK